MRKIIVGVVAAISTVALATPAVAGGTGDFYKSTSCSVSTYARLSVTNWDIATGQRYHIDMNPDTSATPDINVVALYINGIKSYRTNDFYWDDATRSDVNTFKGVWGQLGDGVNTYCKRSL